MPRLSPERVEDRDSRNLRLNHISVAAFSPTIDLAPNPAHDSSVPVTGPALRKASNENSCPACLRSPWKESNECAASSHRSVRHVEPTLPASSVPRPSPLVTVNTAAVGHGIDSKAICSSARFIRRTCEEERHVYAGRVARYEARSAHAEIDAGLYSESARI
jgi:hypothetical protein